MSDMTFDYCLTPDPTHFGTFVGIFQIDGHCIGHAATDGENYQSITLLLYRSRGPISNFRPEHTPTFTGARTGTDNEYISRSAPAPR